MAFDSTSMNNAQQPSDTEFQRTATAFHEAGHAVAAAVLGRPIQKVTIAPANLQTGGLRLGACEIQKGRSKPTKDWLEDEVVIFFAGMVAESQFTNQYCQVGAAQDIRVVRRLLSQSRATSERQLEKLERRLFEKTEYFFEDNAMLLAVELVAAELLAKESISGRAVKHLVQQAEQKYH